jgi:hypothetical protein
MRHIHVVIVMLAVRLTGIAQDAGSSKQQQQPQAEDATALEARYKTCAKHYIPSDKCTPEIYQQLKEKDAAPPDSKTAAALGAVKEYQKRLKNTDSMQVHTAYVTDEGAVCLEIAGQNAMGGLTVSRVVWITPEWKGSKRLKAHWLDEGGFGGSGSAYAQSHSGSGYGVDRWGGPCQKTKAFGRQGDMQPGTDVTEKVNRALKDGK